MNIPVRRLLLPTVLVLCALLSSPARGTQNFNDGALHIVTTTISTDLIITNNSQAEVDATGAINSFTGPTPKPATVHVFDTSALSVLGGTIQRVTGFGNDATSVLLENNSQFLFSGGTLRSTTSSPGNSIGVRAQNNSHVAIVQGSVRASTTASAYGAILNDDSTLEMSGGSLFADGGSFPLGFDGFGLLCNNRAQAIISGGQIDGYNGLAGVDLVANDTSQITLVGSNFNYPLFIPIPDLTGDITGTLANGDIIDFNFQRAAGATITLVPEPATILLAASGLLPMALAARRRPSSPIPASGSCP